MERVMRGSMTACGMCMTLIHRIISWSVVHWMVCGYLSRLGGDKSNKGENGAQDEAHAC
jgi:hypothetical protein